VIRVEPGEWGRARPAEIAAVLTWAGAEILSHIPELPPIPIVVEHSHGHPMTLYGRSEQNEHRVRLSARGRHWYQFAYEFAHELCHILCDHTRYRHREEGWFEESLCELASIFTLRRMGVSWRESPPFPGWARQAGEIQEYVSELLAEPHRQLPPGVQLRDWYRAQAQQLRLYPWDRGRNELVATCLLPAFEERPEGWRTIRYLSPPGDRPIASFSLYLAGWLRRAPRELRPFVADLAGRFGFGLEAIS
jgi:hypothetical protein